eukprot:CAMPEP_0170518704 /NCGR_PEP_ID=MMETSP0209-20121228/4327_1 /TAXON_ID=665100 ORGANISM="Litonotus pictus, Strain P1" /NCGR_SAMPLE_ID=MMETSP0209 /ASSEMBLY_ACC=CAM_ASM_000301 /LENGTH=396 /DNA_ID=CAMNT_0010804353 /DNA_START=1031 /DNA_END=2221 /DNA_ORIENTATION=+
MNMNNVNARFLAMNANASYIEGNKQGNTGITPSSQQINDSARILDSMTQQNPFASHPGTPINSSISGIPSGKIEKEEVSKSSVLGNTRIVVNNNTLVKPVYPENSNNNQSSNNNPELTYLHLNNNITANANPYDLQLKNSISNINNQFPQMNFTLSSQPGVLHYDYPSLNPQLTSNPGMYGNYLVGNKRSRVDEELLSKKNSNNSVFISVQGNNNSYNNGANSYPGFGQAGYMGVGIPPHQLESRVSYLQNLGENSGLTKNDSYIIFKEETPTNTDSSNNVTSSVKKLEKNENLRDLMKEKAKDSNITFHNSSRREKEDRGEKSKSTDSSLLKNRQERVLENNDKDKGDDEGVNDYGSKSKLIEMEGLRDEEEKVDENNKKSTLVFFNDFLTRKNK